MFKSLKLYVGEKINSERFLLDLVDFGYKRQDAVLEEGDFSRRGGIIDIFPFTFELPLRIDLNSDIIERIQTFTPLHPKSPSLETRDERYIKSDLTEKPRHLGRGVTGFTPADGECLAEHRMVIILPVKRAHQNRTIPFSQDYPIDNIIDLNTGDYVVHTRHGIGRFLGLEKIRINDEFRDHLVIQYERQEKLFVPVEEMYLVQKYIAFKGRRPSLSILGSKEWLRVKERVMKGIQKLAWELLSVQAMRMALSGFKYSKDVAWQKEFEATFPYKETPDQIKAWAQVRQDMEGEHPMDRLLCGDVGYGKTEVAMRAAFKAAMDSKQVAFLVPTTILAEQHYQNFISRLEKFPLNVQMLSRFKTDSQQKQIIEGLKEGKVDLVIGTHRMLSDDIQFKDLGLVIIDEEQRFGVKAKEKLKHLRLTCDVLTLTATPIPRTLYMSLMAAKDMSVINTPPQNRLPVRTIVVEYDESIIRQALLKELNRKGQAYVVHNRIRDIDKFKQKIAGLAGAGTVIAVGHGQMPAKALEEVMSRFIAGEIDILVCTMIIQSGIDIPNANTIIVNCAQDFGLSDLHQLRGRVGRFNRPAFAYFLIPKGEYLAADARKRMEAIEKYSQMGAGFNIAMEDMEIRGAGNLLGLEQHGFIQAVGFDLYCRLLREAVTHFRKAGIGTNV